MPGAELQPGVPGSIDERQGLSDVSKAPVRIYVPDDVAHFEKDSPLLMGITGFPVDFQRLLEHGLRGLELSDVFDVGGLKTDDMGRLQGIAGPARRDSPRLVQRSARAFEISRDPLYIAARSPCAGDEIGDTLLAARGRVEPLGHGDAQMHD